MIQMGKRAKSLEYCRSYRPDLIGYCAACGKEFVKGGRAGNPTKTCSHQCSIIYLHGKKHEYQNTRNASRVRSEKEKEWGKKYYQKHRAEQLLKAKKYRETHAEQTHQYNVDHVEIKKVQNHEYYITKRRPQLEQERVNQKRS